MATGPGRWPKKRSTQNAAIVFAFFRLFRLFSTVFALFRSFWPKNDQHKTPRSFLHFFACFRLFSTVFALFRSFSHFLSGLFLTVFGRPFSHFFAPFACCHLAAAIWIPLILTRCCSDRSILMNIRAACPSQHACLSRIWSAWPQCLTGCAWECPAQNFLLGLVFHSLS